MTDLVVLVHGMGRTPLSMWPLGRTLRRAGYRVLNFGYSSYGPSIEDIGRRLERRLSRVVDREKPDRVHFVGHSLGSIVIRWLMVVVKPANVGRVVMLAPPNRGAAAADRLTPYVGWLLSPISELTTRSESTVRRMPPPKGIEVGIIVGDRDGKVQVEESYLPGMAEHVVVPAGHTFVMMKPSVQIRVLNFIRRGHFADAEGYTASEAGNRPSA